MTGEIRVYSGKLYLIPDPEPKRKAKLWPIVFAFLLGLWVDLSIHRYDREESERAFQIRQECIDKSNAIITVRRQDFAKTAKLRNTILGIGMEF